MSTTNTVEGFSLSHVAILGTGGVPEDFGDVYGVNSASLELDQDSYDNTGDDAVLSTWNWGNKANLTVQGGYLPFDTYGLLSGAKVISSGSGANAQFSANLWEEESFNTKPRPVLVRIPAKDAVGNPRVIDLILYRVQFQPITFEGPSYKEGLKVNYNGSALLSPVDETGAPVLNKAGNRTKAIGRIVSTVG